jgi:hypothetical protein
MPPVVEHEHAATVLCLLELPFVALGGHVPAATSGGHDLHVAAHRITDLSGHQELMQSDERRITQIVLEDLETDSTGRRRSQHSVGAGEVPRERLLNLDVKPGFEDLRCHLCMVWCRDQYIDGIRLLIQQLLQICRRNGTREIPSPPLDPVGAVIAQSNDVDIAVGRVRRHHELGNLTESNHTETKRTAQGQRARHEVSMAVLSSRRDEGEPDQSETESEQLQS